MKDVLAAWSVIFILVIWSLETFGQAVCPSRGPSRGHALILSTPYNEFDQNTRRALESLSSHDPATLGFALKYMGPKAGGRIVNVSLDEDSAHNAFKSLSSYVSWGKFQGPVILGVQDDSDDAAARALNGINLENALITERWNGITTLGRNNLFVRFKERNKIIVVAIENPETAPCDSMQDRLEGPPDYKNESLAPEQKLFQVPLHNNLELRYFFGPRIKSSPSIGAKPPPVLIKTMMNLKDFLIKNWEFHTGVDMRANVGTAVVAPFDGTVETIMSKECEGNAVILKHTLPETQKTVFSIYFHLSDFAQGLKPLRTFKAGETIAYSGDTGSRKCIQGAHLHFELRETAAGPFARSPDLAQRWSDVFEKTNLVNPANYIEAVDNLCQQRKIQEIQNALIAQKQDPQGLPPLTAGICSQKFENVTLPLMLKNGSLPKIYSVKTKHDIARFK